MKEERTSYARWRLVGVQDLELEREERDVPVTTVGGGVGVVGGGGGVWFFFMDCLYCSASRCCCLRR